jgi:hypothetical protein
MGKTLEAAHKSMQDSLSSIPGEFSANVENEVKLIKNRMYALKLVRGCVSEEAGELDDAAALACSSGGGHAVPLAAAPPATPAAAAPVVGGEKKDAAEETKDAAGEKKADDH